MTDAVVVVGCLVVAYLVRFDVGDAPTVAGVSSVNYVVATACVGVMWLIWLAATRSREPQVLGHGHLEFSRVLGATWGTFSVVAVVSFSLKAEFSRGLLLIALPLGAAALALSRMAWRVLLRRLRARGRAASRVLVVGPESAVRDAAARLHSAPGAGYVVAGVCAPPAVDQATIAIPGAVSLGPLVDVRAQAKQVTADYVLIAGMEGLSSGDVRRLGWELEGTAVGLIMSPGLVDVAGPRVVMSPVHGLPLLHVDPPAFVGGKFWVKAIADRLGAASLLVVGAVPMALVALVVRVSSRGPAIFAQERIGKDGQPFRMYKFRTMVLDASSQLDDVHGGEPVGVYYKLADDPRVTRVGRVLRRFSLDELPQIINVLRGDMSLVGPRPQIAREVAQYDDLARRRLLVTPGMTGLWQVSGRSSLSAEESVRLDAYYAENWSVVGDILIMARTVIAVVTGRGAY